MPKPAAAEGEENWQLCIASATAPDQRVAACSTVIDGKTETGERLAGADCNRGHGLTEQHHFDAALTDLNEAIRIDPSYPCAYNNRGRVYAFMHDLDRAISDYDEAIRLQPSFALAYNNRDARLGKANVPGAIADFRKAQLRSDLPTAREALQKLGVKL